MPPPYLARNAPVANIVHPVKKGVFPGFGIDFCLPLLDRGYGLFSQGFDRDEPLFGKTRLYHSLTAVTMSHAVLILFNLFQQSQFFKIIHYLPATGKTVHSRINTGFFIHNATAVHDLQGRQVMPAANLKVIEVMGRGNLQCPGAKLFLHMRIKNYRDLAVNQGQHNHFLG